MFNDRILPPVSGGKRGRGTVSKIFSAIVLRAARKRDNSRQATNLFKRERLLLRSEPPAVRVSGCRGLEIRGSKAQNSRVASSLQ